MIYLIYATIRISAFIDNVNFWLMSSKNANLVKIKVAVNTEQEKEQLRAYDGIDVVVTNSPKIGYCFSMNELTKDLELKDDDIIIFLADDIFCPKHWDEYILGKFNNFNGCLMLDDGYQTKLSLDSGVLPSLNIPAMTFECLKKINKRLFHPSYTHFFADNELYYNMLELGLLKDDRFIDNMIFEHHHYWINGKRERDQYDMEYSKYASEDRNIFESRRTISVNERIL